MVGGAFELAHFALDAGGSAACGERLRQQHVVDAQAEIALEAAHAVVPPREALLRLREAAEAVDEAQVEQAPEGGALGVGTEDLAGPGGGVVHVAVFGSDVVVAGDDELRMRAQLVFDPAGQRVEPGQLVRVLVAADRLSVRHVGGDHAHAVDGRRDQPLLLVGKARVADDDLGRGLAREQRDAVVGLLPRERHLVTGRLDLGARELVVLKLGFLQADHVGLRDRQPVEQLRQADFQGVHVPGGDFQVFSRSAKEKEGGALVVVFCNRRDACAGTDCASRERNAKTSLPLARPAAAG